MTDAEKQEVDLVLTANRLDAFQACIANVARRLRVGATHDTAW